MARRGKKIRFPLVMGDGAEVRSVAELQEHFSLPEVLAYLKNGKLVTWLRNFYEEELADKAAALDPQSEDLPEQLCRLFDVDYEAQEDAAERKQRLEELQKYTSDQRFLDHVDTVAFDQDELYDLLDENETDIYLCGERFTIPLGKKGVSYTGVNDPVVVIGSKTPVDWAEKGITLSGVRYDEKYQKVLEKAALPAEQTPVERKDPFAGGYVKTAYLNFMLTPAEKRAAESLYQKASEMLNGLIYDVDDDIRDVKQQLQDGGLIGMADDFLASL